MTDSEAGSAKVILMRHAHAEWPAWDGSDFDRPLTGQGEADARAAGRALQSAGLCPALVLASPALRTRLTAQIIARELGWPAALLRFEDRLYNASAETLAAALRDVDPATCGPVMLVAHNPGISELARRLAGSATMAPGFAPAAWRALPWR